MSKPDLRKRKEQPVVIVGTILGSVFLAGAGTILFLYRNFAPRADVQEVKESIREFDNRVRTLEITSREMGVTIEGLRQATLSGVRVIQRRPPQQVSGVGTTTQNVRAEIFMASAMSLSRPYETRSLGRHACRFALLSDSIVTSR